MVANRKDLEYFAKSLNVIQKDSVGKETFVEVYGEKNKSQIRSVSQSTIYQEIYIHPLSRLTLSTIYDPCNQFSSVQSLSHVWLFATPWITALQVSLSITNSRSSLRLTSIESVIPSSHLVLCRPLLLLPPIPPSIRVFSNESTLLMRWPKYWSFSFSISPSDEHPGMISFM